jgi:hypothetical protein
MAAAAESVGELRLPGIPSPGIVAARFREEAKRSGWRRGRENRWKSERKKNVERMRGEERCLKRWEVEADTACRYSDTR